MVRGSFVTYHLKTERFHRNSSGSPSAPYAISSFRGVLLGASMRSILLVTCLAMSLGGCSSLYPEYTPLIQDEIVANRDNLSRELAQRDPPARLMFGMMISKARCDVFWQELEQHRTVGDLALSNLQYIAKTIPPVLAGPLNERAVANTIWAIGLGAELVKSKNEIALLAVDKYRNALREKTDAKQKIYYDANKAYAEELLARGPAQAWSRIEADEVNFRIYSYARLCTRPELMMTFEQLITQSRITTEEPPPPTSSLSRSRSATRGGGPSRSPTDLPTFSVAR